MKYRYNKISKIFLCYNPQNTEIKKNKISHGQVFAGISLSETRECGVVPPSGGPLIIIACRGCEDDAVTRECGCVWVPPSAGWLVRMACGVGERAPLG